MFPLKFADKPSKHVDVGRVMQIEPNIHYPSKLACRSRPRNRTRVPPIRAFYIGRRPRSLADYHRGQVDKCKATLLQGCRPSWKRDPEDVNAGLRTHTHTPKHSLLNRSAVLPFWITDSRYQEEAETSRSENGRPCRDFVKFGSHVG